MCDYSGRVEQREENRFLLEIKRDILLELNPVNSGELIAFFLKYTYDEGYGGYFSHLQADIFNEKDNPIYEKPKNKITELINAISVEFPEQFNVIKDRCDLSLLKKTKSETPLNDYLANLYQFPADFSVGYLGTFYPFCKFTKKCYKDHYHDCSITTANYSIDNLKGCGFWLNPEGEGDDYNEKLEQIKTKEQKLKILKDLVQSDNMKAIDYMKYVILSEVEGILFNISSTSHFILLPIINRDQLKGLFYIKSQEEGFSKRIESKLSTILDSIIPQINSYYDNKFYQSIFTALEDESNYSKILGNPKLLSNAFAIREYLPKDQIYDSNTSRMTSFLDYAIKEGKIKIFFNEATITLSTYSLSQNGIRVEYDRFFQNLIDTISNADKIRGALFSKNLRTAIISILIDSYAHNISAHSLAALKWWFESRFKILDYRFSVPAKSSDLYSIGLSQINYQASTETTGKYYEALGLTDSSYGPGYYSLYDFLLFMDPETTSRLLSLEDEVELCKDDEHTKKILKTFVPRFPIPIDHAMFPLIRFLRDKGAFWSGVTRNIAYGGETKSWFTILWEDFANNPLYLGTIAYSEGVSKLNINLAVKNSKDNKWIKGRFVTIDMSIIKYEEKISQNTNLSPDSELLKNDIKEDICKYDANCALPYDKYSKYAFVKLGKCFKGFRELLDDIENYGVFLPGGVVGEHALFTIIENTIRNIKHYRSDRNIVKNGVDLWVSIQEDNMEKSGSNKSQLFKVGVWLGHSTELMLIKDDESMNELLIKRVVESSLLPIINQDGSPKMGGNSQDKACAAMLFNNKFSHVETTDEERDKKFYPWVTYSTSKTTTFDDEQSISLQWEGGKVSINQDSIDSYITNHYGSSNTPVAGFLKKSFYLWRGIDVMSISYLTNSGKENPARTRFIVKEKSHQNTSEFTVDELVKARKNGIIRLIEVNEKNDNQNLLSMYPIWLKKWISSADKFIISIYDNYSEKLQIKIFDDKKIHSTSYHCNSGQTNISLRLTHGSEKQHNCNVRSHGAFMKKFFDEIPQKNLDCLDMYPDVYDKYISEKKNKYDALFYEFFEVISTKIVVFDDRLYARLPESYHSSEKGDSYSKYEMLQNDLRLLICPEKIDEFKILVDNNTNNDVNILVMHLSFIEQMKINNTNIKYSEDTLSQFITNELSTIIQADEKTRDNFIFVLTSGRGRDKWRESLREDDHRYDQFTIFKPVESLLSAIENGVSYNDHFDIKYNLMKVLFGN